MYQVGFEPMAPVFERAKTVHASERVATVTGNLITSSGQEMKLSMETARRKWYVHPKHRQTSTRLHSVAIGKDVPFCLRSQNMSSHINLTGLVQGFMTAFETMIMIMMMVKLFRLRNNRGHLEF
jgi:hypothetical protein